MNVDINWAKNNFNKRGVCGKSFIYYSKKSDGRIDWVNLNDLPKKRGKLDYSLGEYDNTITFEYNNIKDTFKLIKIINKRMTIIYKDEQYTISADAMRQVALGKILKVKPNIYTTPFKYNVGDVTKGCKVLKQYRKKSSKKEKMYTLYNLEYELEFETYESNLMRSPKENYIPSNCVYNPLINKLNEEQRKHLIDSVDYSQYNVYSNIPEKFKCKNKGCDHIKEYKVGDFYTYGFSCDICTMNISFPERYAREYFTELKIEFEFQKTYEDFKKHRFDFLLPNNMVLVEVNGMAHYKECKGYMDYKKTHASDERKKKYAKENNIDIIFIDARYSDPTYLRNSFEQTFEKITNEQHDNILTRVNNDYFINKEKFSSDYYQGMFYKDLGLKYNISISQVENVLNKFNLKRRDNVVMKKVKCLNNGMIFNSVRDASKYAGLARDSGVSGALNKRAKSAGKHPITGEKLTWEYVD